ncbi:Saccharopine dehydrogenase-domain-containing protein [Dactylonectria estremocensis]|uniref:Saccharopine dehydrogenase-domain-containing protein n=1 Tax=Dactylonectria estremocensis TaxID=1079267 RepID=A0A9P9FKI4_9HYPO|nr:Saccharopine dehydrogenase-domain-containing protein [Dactylonectria estremocensis]
MARQTDIVLLGATGYTGRLCATYMAKALPETVTWALAGRSEAKLEIVASKLEYEGAAKFAVCAQSLTIRPPKGKLYALDLASDDAIAELARSARVIVNVIGPYASTCGTSVIKACAENGTDYVDCGEMPWLQEMIAEYDEVAQASGAKIIFTAGWGAVPADLSTYLAVQHIQKTFGLRTREVLVSLDDVRGSFSGGSINSLCDLVGTYGPARIAAASAPFRLTPLPRRPTDISGAGVLPSPNSFGVQTVDGLGVLVAGTQADIETAIVGRSWGLYAGVAHASQRPDSYGHDFYFSSRMRMSNAVTAWSFRTAFMLLNTALTHIPPLRTLVSRLFPTSTGPSATERVRHHFRYRTLAIADASEDAAAPKIEVEFAYDGDSYVFTGISLTEAALLLLEGGTPAHERGGGILTPALLGEKLAERLKRPGADVRIYIKAV